MVSQIAQPAAGNPAAAYEQHFVPAIFGPWAEELLQRTAPRPGERVLDVACGTGAVTRRVAPLVGVTGAVTGLDRNPAMLEVARGLPPAPGAAITWLEGDAAALPLPDASLDLVLCQQGLQFFPDRAAAVREMYRMLAPGGRIGLSVWRDISQQGPIADFDAVTERHLGLTPDDTPFSFGDPDALRALLVAAGFREIVIETVRRPVHYPSLDQFVRNTTLAAAAVAPDLATLSDTARENLIAAIERELRDTLETYRDGNGLTHSMTANIATARH